MKTHAEYDIHLPEWSLSYIYNDDASGLEDGEETQIKEGLAHYYEEAARVGGHVVFSPLTCDGEILRDDFNRRPEFGLACATEETRVSILVND